MRPLALLLITALGAATRPSEVGAFRSFFGALSGPGRCDKRGWTTTNVPSRCAGAYRRAWCGMTCEKAASANETLGLAFEGNDLNDTMSTLLERLPCLRTLDLAILRKLTGWKKIFYKSFLISKQVFLRILYKSFRRKLYKKTCLEYAHAN